MPVPLFFQSKAKRKKEREIKMIIIPSLGKREKVRNFHNDDHDCQSSQLVRGIMSVSLENGRCWCNRVSDTVKSM